MQRARDIMSHPVISVGPTTPITEVARTLMDNAISGCPVVDNQGRLRGIISRSNLLDYASTVESEARSPIIRSLVPGFEEEDEAEETPPETENEDVLEAQDIMVGDVITVPPDMLAPQIAAIMSRERIHRVPVVDGAKILGIITSLDLLEVMATGERKDQRSARR
jgi:CBS domain-containing protein